MMAKAPKLKVFRTPIGFHDAYVAVPSRKAALAAWGANADLFARGVAEEVTDATLAEEPLARPGEIVRRLRESPDDEAPPHEKTAAKAAARSPPNAAPKPKPKPRPSRDALDAAEQALANAEARHEEALQALSARLAALERERRALEKAADAERERLRNRRDKAAAAYEEALDRWRG